MQSPLLAPNKTLAAQLYGEMTGIFPAYPVESFLSYDDDQQPEAQPGFLTGKGLPTINEWTWPTCQPLISGKHVPIHR